MACVGKKPFPLFCSYQGTYVAVGISEDDKMGEDLVKRHLQIAKYGSVIVTQISNYIQVFACTNGDTVTPGWNRGSPKANFMGTVGGAEAAEVEVAEEDGAVTCK